MTNNEYLADILASIGVQYDPESTEHKAIESVIEILTDR